MQVKVIVNKEQTFGTLEYFYTDMLQKLLHQFPPKFADW